MNNLQLILFCIATLFSCKTNEVINKDQNSDLSTVNITVDGRDRNFLVYKPKEFKSLKNLPLVFVNHGGQGSSQGMLKVADFRTLADEEKFILIYPQGYQNYWNDGRTTPSNLLGVNDVNFFRQMCDYATKNLAIDTAKIYVTGLSNGGFMASRLACELSDKITAIAVVGATFEQGVFDNCKPKKPVPAIVMQGTRDPIVLFNGGNVNGDGYAVSHSQAVSKLVQINKCSSTPTISNLPDKVNDGTTVVETKYINTATNKQVISYAVINGGHTWAQGYQYLSEAIIGKTTQDINANEVIWSFFKQYKKD
ncbi:MAG: alpha/beta hydrolase family esterase [Leadbetterella sp.]